MKTKEQVAMEEAFSNLLDAVQPLFEINIPLRGKIVDAAIKLQSAAWDRGASFVRSLHARQEVLS